MDTTHPAVLARPAPEPAARAGAPPRQDVTEYGLRRVLIVVGVMAAALMQTLDTTISNVALPTIQGNLGASQDEGSWVVTSYTIAAIIVIPLTPWLQDRFGRKLYFCVSIVGFTVASVACGLSESLSFLVMARVVQGAFGGGLLATAQAVLRDTFPPKQLGMSQAIFALGAIMGPALGPPLGGYLVDNYTWNLCFDINVVPGTLATVLLFLLLRDPTKPRSTAVDLAGLALLAITLSTMQYVFTEGERHYWFADTTILLMTVACIASMIAFIWWELRKAKVPIVDLRIFKNRSVAAGSLLALVLGLVIFGTTYTLPQLTQGPLGFTPTLSGDLFLLRALPIALLTPFIPRLAARMDTRWLLGIGFVVIGIGTWLQGDATTGTSWFWTFAVSLILVGAGASLLFVPISIAVLGATTPAEGPKAGAMVNLATQLGGSIGIALLDVLIDRRMSLHSDVLAGNVTLANPAIQQYLHHGGTLDALTGLVTSQAAILAYADATWATAAIAFVSIPLVLLMRKPKPLAGPVEIGG